MKNKNTCVIKIPTFFVEHWRHVIPFPRKSKISSHHLFIFDVENKNYITQILFWREKKYMAKNSLNPGYFPKFRLVSKRNMMSILIQKCN